MHRGPVRKPGNELFLQRTFGGRRRKILEKDLLYRSFAGELSERVLLGTLKKMERMLWKRVFLSTMAVLGDDVRGTFTGDTDRKAIFFFARRPC